ncbi:MAG: rhomboid family intramembrane serine protease [Bacilli bacterium]|nr:rhomboid family intramembrane serine protease [Bacilli bacterium]
MENEIVLDDKNLIVMKLLHYFITEKNYNPIILQGVENEIWLENLDEECKVVRIVSSYIHNDEQFNFDVFKTKRIISKIKKKTFSFNINVMSIFLDMGENVKEDINTDPKLIAINVHDEDDLKKSSFIKNIFPDLISKMKYSEEGVELFLKISNDINRHNMEDASKMDKLFSSKVPYVTYILLAINILLFIVPLLFFGENAFNRLLVYFCVHGSSIREGQYYRLLTGIFLHGSLMHLFCNCYALYVLGPQIESFFGKVKYLIIYLFSGIMGSLFSMTFLGNDSVSIGASGAIFGLMGALLYFGYHYRVYLGNVVKTQIIPLILINLALGFVLHDTIDNFSHIGGLIGGFMITRSIGIKDKTSKSEMINGYIITAIFTIFMIYIAFVYSVR